jgi:hypothetical protein
MFARFGSPITVPPMLRRLLFVSLALATGIFAAAATPAVETPACSRVDVAPTKTSVYVAWVTMTMPTFVRTGQVYATRYHAAVVPWAFYSEAGKLDVEVTDAQLDALAQGKVITFKGLAVRDDGKERQVEGKATPTDATSGKLKVHVHVSQHVDLIFNTTYRFVGAP